MRYKVLSKVCYKISSAEKLLNGITSNELTKEKNAFLDRFGKLVVLFDQKVMGDAAYLVFESKFEQRFLSHIKPFSKLVKARIEKIPMKVLHIIEEELGEMRFPQPIGYLALLEELPNSPELSEKEYEMIRIENNMPLQGIDFDNEMFLDTGIDAVSFTKGCFLGQEVMARVHNLGKPGRKIARILYDKIPEHAACNGKYAGRITSACFSKKYNKFLCFAMIAYELRRIDGGEILPY